MPGSRAPQRCSKNVAVWFVVCLATATFGQNGPFRLNQFIRMPFFFAPRANPCGCCQSRLGFILSRPGAMDGPIVWTSSKLSINARHGA